MSDLSTDRLAVVEAVARRYEQLAAQTTTPGQQAHYQHTAGIVRRYAIAPDYDLPFLLQTIEEAERKHLLATQRTGQPVTGDPSLLPTLDAAYARLQHLNEHRFKNLLNRLMPPAEMDYFFRYFNDRVRWCNARGFYYSEWVKSLSWGEAYHFVDLYNLLRERDRKQSKNVYYKPQRLVRYQKEFELRVVHRDEKAWAHYQAQRHQLAEEGRVKRKVKKRVEKIKKKIDQKFPLFADMLLQEETKRIEQEEKDKKHDRFNENTDSDTHRSF
jgi:hypothetical protein